MSDEQTRLVDPDPFTVASVWLAGASCLLQFVQLARDIGNASGKPTAVINPDSRMPLQGMEAELSQLRRELRTVSRAIDHGSKAPQSEFYDLKFRIGVGVLRLELAHHQEYRTSLGQAFSRVGNLSMWINLIISDHPALGADIGTALLDKLGDASGRLNKFIETGTNEQLIFEARTILDLATEIIDRALGGN